MLVLGILQGRHRRSVRTVYKIRQQDELGSGRFRGDVYDKALREWKKLASNYFEETLEEYIIEAIAQSHFQKKHLMSCTF
jgi:hypothetical protein